MLLSEYYQEYAAKPDQEIAKRAEVKAREIKQVFESISYGADHPLRIAVMGCGDKRFIKYHREIFEKYSRQKTDITTFDLDIKHLEGELGVVEHDCTQPLPSPPYDIVYAHVLLRFLPPEKQIDCIINSYNALADKGVALHFIDEEERDASSERLSDDLYAVPLRLWKEKLVDAKIGFKELEIKTGPDMDFTSTVLILTK